MKKSFFKLALIVLSIAAIQSCSENNSKDILDPDVPLTAESVTDAKPCSISGDQVGAYCVDMEVLTLESNS